MKIEVNDRQAQLLVDALDLYSRILIGQFEEVARLATWYRVTTVDDGRWEKFHEFGDRIRALKAELLGFSRSGSWGIYNPEVNDNARVAYDMQQVIRHTLAYKRNPAGGHTVDFGTPHQSGPEPLIQILPE